jgi:hypothetical protein
MLYHTVPIKTDWLSAEVREEAAFPPDIAALFPYGVRDAARRLSIVAALTLGEHCA